MEKFEKQLIYWKNILPESQPMIFPKDHYADDQGNNGYSGLEFKISQETNQQMNLLTQQYGVALHEALLSSVHIFLSRYTGQNDIVIFSPFSDLQISRTLPGSGPDYVSVMRHVYQQHLDAPCSERLPFEKLLKELSTGQDMQLQPLFQVSFTSGSDPAPQNDNKTPFSLSFHIGQDKGKLCYAKQLLSEETAARIIRSYLQLLDQLVAAPDQHYSEHSLLNTAEYQQLTHDWSGTDANYEADKSISQLFEEQTARKPEHIALIYGTTQFSYRSLNEKSNQLAAFIRKQYQEKTGKELSADTLIALYLDKSIELLVGMFAILKAGAAYIPIDTKYPQERVDYLLKDTDAQLILCKKTPAEAVHHAILPQEKVLYIDLSEACYQTEETSNPPIRNQPGDLAYVIYTSGTTGKPKGVMISHDAIRSLVESDAIKVKEEHVFAFLSSPVFDAATFEIFTPLLKGNPLVIPGNDVKDLVSDVPGFKHFLKTHRISVVFLTKTLFDSLYHLDNSIYKDLDYLITGGETLDKKLINELITGKSKPAYFLAAYGPTESTTYTSTCELFSSGITVNSVPIGKPLRNRKMYVLDQNQQPVPIGVTAELYIGGAGIARGYLNQPLLTQERFISNPFASATDQLKGHNRLYKTGDLVRWMPDGNIEFMGRNDDQVKIRGFRVEPAEIENAITGIKGIRQCRVIVREKKNNKYMAAYYVWDEQAGNTDHTAIIDNWEHLYDTSVYGSPVAEEETEYDFSGWSSYITGKPIPLAEMQLWRSHTLEIIKSLNPKRVLEIGVGSGLLMYPLLAEVKEYTGLDFSAPVINRHQAYLKRKNYPATLYHLKADQLDLLPAQPRYDTIIINSVCQYFPNISYFNEVLEKAISRLSDHGSLFIGDIRNYDYQMDLIRDKFRYDAQEYQQQDLDQAALKENELLISPQYFLNLSDQYENISVTVFERNLDSYNNELSRYRYDVVISANGNQIIRKHTELFRRNPGSNYNIPYGNHQTGKEKILRQLSATLPDYMIPDVFIQMAALPLNINGKLDKQALPDPDFNASTAEYVAPGTAMETTMCQIWQEILFLDRIGINDNFFRIGGNSILAIALVARISRQLQLIYPVTELLKYKTIAALLRQGQTQTRTISEEAGISEGKVHHFEQLLYHHELSLSESLVYNESVAISYQEHITIGQLRKAATQLLAWNEVLHSNYQLNPEGLLQRNINTASALICEELNLAQNEDLNAFLFELGRKPFDVAKDKLIRFYLIQTPEQQILLISSHHLIIDATTMTNILLPQLYTALFCGPTGNPVKHISDFQQLSASIEAHYAHHAAEKLNYWKENLLSCEPLELASAGRSGDNKGEQFVSILGAEVKDQLQLVAERLNLSIYVVLQGLFSIVLAKISGKNKIAIPTNVDERILAPEYNDVPGCFINNTFIISSIDTTNTVATHLCKSAEHLLPAISNMLPYSTLLALNRELVMELSDIHFNLETQEASGLPYEQSYQHAHSGEVKKGLYFELEIKQSGIFIRTQYQTDRYEPSLIEALFNGYISLLQGISNIIDQKINSLSLLTPKQRQQILYTWNGTSHDFPNETTIHDLFQKRARQWPENTALVYGKQQLTYRELEEQSNRLAIYISNCCLSKTKQESRPMIALYLQRSPEMVISILAVLKAGATYVPIDTEYPAERIQYILDDTKALLILTQAGLQPAQYGQLPAARTIFVDQPECFSESSNAESYPLPSCSAGDLAYVLYTSGTTGKPKGVMLSHEALLSLMYNDYMEVRENEVFAFLASPVFDIALFEIFTSLLNGCRLIIPENVKDLSADIFEFKSFLTTNQVSALCLSKTLFESLYHADQHLFEGLNYLLVGGEALDKKNINKLLASSSKPKHFMNAYGPTESTVFTSTYMLSDKVTGNSVPIGRPISNRKIYILDQDNQPVPPGITGELHVAGAGLAKGYLNLPDLTDARFIQNPFATEADKIRGYTRMYKSGDLARWLPDGNIEFIGRNDGQVKIRGYRIEPEEIANTLSELKGVRQSCVLVRERKTEAGEQKYLIGYYVPSNTVESVSADALLDQLVKILPDYMIPAALIPMESFPLSLNGKLDTQAFPAPDFNSDAADYVAPSTEEEKIICQIWQEVLSLERVSIQDNFFRIGGNSILAIQAAHRMSRALGYPVKVSDVFSRKNIAALVNSFSVEQDNIEWEI